MSSCLSGGGPTYKLDLEIIKSTSTSSWTSHSSSPSSTISESSNSPLGISTRKARTPRKRPNQTYNEAAALLYTACPKIFSTKHLSKPCSSTKPSNPFSCESSSDLLLHFQAMENSGFLLHQPILDKPSFQIEQKVGNYHEKPCQSPLEINFLGKNSLDSSDAYEEDFDAESILDEDIEEGLDSIMGNVSVNNDSVEESNVSCYNGLLNSWYGYPMRLGFGRYSDFGFGISQNVRAFRQVDNGDWWRYPAVNVVDIMPKVDKVTIEKKKKKVKKTVELISLESPKENSIHRASSLSSKENSIPKSPKEDRNPVQSPGLLLKLNYDNVLKAWSNSGSPFSEEIPGSDCPGTGNDIHARLAQIDLLLESGGVREARVLRYKEKRRSRLFSKKIRYNVRKVNADQRPRMKGRFVRRPNSPDTEQRWVKSADV